jgi:ribose transport system substrate-binding protein
MKRIWMTMLFVALLAVCVVSITACGSSSSSSSSSETTESSGSETGGTAEETGEEPAEETSEEPAEETGEEGEGGYPASFESMLEEAKSSPTEWKGPTTSPAFKKNMLVYSIPCSKVAEGCVRVNEGIKAAAAKMGWQFKSINPEGDVGRSGAAIEEATNAGADVIFDIAIDPSLVSGPIKKAREAGITVMCASCAAPESDVGPNKLSGQVGLDAVEQGELMAAFLAVESEGNAKVAFLDDPEFGVVNARVEGFKPAFEQCSACEIVAESKFTAAEITTSLAQKTQSFLQSNPSAEYIWVPYDSAAAPVVQAVGETGSQVQTVAFDGNVPNIQYVAEGKQLATIGSALEWTGWAAVDDANRLLNGEEELPEPGIPNILITEENASSYEKAGFQGDADYQAKYEELWQSGKTDSSLKSEGP